VIRYPIDVRAWDGAGPAGTSQPRILTVGRLEARKAPEVLLRAGAQLQSEVPDVEVVFIGRDALRNGGSYKTWLVQLAHELSVPCRFIDEVPRSELPDWYGSARVVVVPSRYDNFPWEEHPVPDAAVQPAQLTAELDHERSEFRLRARLGELYRVSARLGVKWRPERPRSARA
jgi:hypothetical protein